MAGQGQEARSDPVSGRTPLTHPSPTLPNTTPPIYQPMAFGPCVTWGNVRPSPVSSLWTTLVRHKTLTIALAGLLAFALVIGCAGLAFALHSMFATPDGYLYTSNTSVAFVQFTTDKNGHMSGTFQEVSATSSETISTQESAFTGVLDGSQVSLTFSALGFSATVTGTLNGNTLTLHIPDANGYMATEVFQGAQVADYNDAVAQLRQRTAAHALATQAAEATVSAEQAKAQATASAQSSLDQAVSGANSAVASDLNTLNSDAYNLSHEIDFSAALGEYASTWQQMQADYQHEQSDYQQGCGAYGANAGQVQADAGQVQADLGAIQADDGGLQASESSAQALIPQINSAITSLQTDWANLQSAAGADPNGSVAAQFTANDVNGAISSAQQQTNAANSALQSAQNQAKQYDTEAAKTAADAQNLANSMKC